MPPRRSHEDPDIWRPIGSKIFQGKASYSPRSCCHRRYKRGEFESPENIERWAANRANKKLITVAIMTDLTDQDNPYLTESQLTGKRKKSASHFGGDASESNKTKTFGSKAGGSLPKQSVAGSERQTASSYIYGNYRNYYDVRRNKGQNRDSRFDVLDGSLFRDKKVLDIGCNSGNFTIGIGLQYRPSHILGVDIDPDLIRQAEILLRTTNSLRDPKSEKNDSNQRPFDIGMRFHYFPKSLPFMFGSMPMAVPPSFHSTEFPYNVSFEACDWMEVDVEAEQYDTILALSLTKWIQLHHGDEGIKRFFNKVHRALKPGGVFVVEPQRFETYQRKAKQFEHTQQVFEQLSFLPEQYKDYLLNDVGFANVEERGASSNENKGFERPIYLYTK